MNVAISRKSDKFFKAGREYKISGFGAGYVEIVAEGNNSVRADIDDKDFVLIFNRDTDDKIEVASRD